MEQGSHVPSVEGHKPYYGFIPSNIADQIAQGAMGAGKFIKDAGKDLASNPNWFQSQPQGQRPSSMQKFVFNPADEQMAIARQKAKVGQHSEAWGHGLAAVMPGIGPYVAGLGEQAGKGDIGGAAGQAIGAYGAGKYGGELIEKAIPTGKNLLIQGAW